MPSTKKVAVVDQLTKQLEENQNITLIGFDKTSHIALEQLRKSLRNTNARVTVVKTSLLEKAIQKVSAFGSFKESSLPIKVDLVNFNDLAKSYLHSVEKDKIEV